MLTVSDWLAYRRSAERRAPFADNRPVSHVLSGHVEMKRRARQHYPPRTVHQPDEHVLQLGHEHLREWHRACELLGDDPRPDLHDDFLILPL